MNKPFFMTKRSHLLLVPLSLLLAIPFASSAAFGDSGVGLVVCGNNSGGATGPTSNHCTFVDLVNKVQVVINFLIFKIAAPLAAVMFAYAGFLYLTNGGNEGRIKEAHELFTNVLFGLILALAAWMIMSFILTFFLGGTSAFNLLG